MGKNQEIYALSKRIKELEEKVEQLRLSRRVLMNLVERVEQEKINTLSRLEKENQKLHHDKLRYARSLWMKNRQILEMASKLKYLHRGN